MKFLIVYATTDGQTRRIVRHCADLLVDAGHGVEVVPASDAGALEAGRWSAVILAGSVHIEGYQWPLVRYARENAETLKTYPTLFLSVSLSAAGQDAHDWQGLETVLEEFVDSTRWAPGRVEQVAGAYLPSAYDPLQRWAMRRVIRERDPHRNPAEDHEYTDWPRLDATVCGWVSEVGRP